MSDYLTDIMALSSTIVPTLDDEPTIHINGITRKFTFSKNYNKIIANKYDEKSNLLNFSCSRYIDGVDVTKCSLHLIKWENQNSGEKGIYKIENISTGSLDSQEVIFFNWLLDELVATEVGPLWFSVCFLDIDDVYAEIDENYEKYATYKWQSNICKELTIGESIFVNGIDDDEKKQRDLISEIEDYQYGIDPLVESYWPTKKVENTFSFSNISSNDRTSGYLIALRTDLVDEDCPQIPQSWNNLPRGRYKFQVKNFDSNCIKSLRLTLRISNISTSSATMTSEIISSAGNYYIYSNLENFSVDWFQIQVVFKHPYSEAHLETQLKLSLTEAINLEELPEIYEHSYKDDEPNLLLNLQNRTLSLPENYKYNTTISNAYDHFSNLITIKTDGDSIDGIQIKEHPYLVMKWQAADGTTGANSLNYKELENNNLLFEWIVPTYLAIYKGKIRIALCFFTTQSDETGNEEVIYKWQSNVFDGFSVGESIFVEDIDNLPYLGGSLEDLIVEYNELREMILEVYGIDINNFNEEVD